MISSGGPGAALDFHAGLLYLMGGAVLAQEMFVG